RPQPAPVAARGRTPRGGRVSPPFPRLSSPLPLLEGPGDGLYRAGAARGRPFSVTGRRAAAWGTELRGIEDAHAAGWRLVGRLGVGAGPASSLVAGPLSVRRELVAGGGSVLETILVAPDLPAVGLQWRRPAGASTPLTV